MLKEKKEQVTKKKKTKTAVPKSTAAVKVPRIKTAVKTVANVKEDKPLKVAVPRRRSVAKSKTKEIALPKVKQAKEEVLHDKAVKIPPLKVVPTVVPIKIAEPPVIENIIKQDSPKIEEVKKETLKEPKVKVAVPVAVPIPPLEEKKEIELELPIILKDLAVKIQEKPSVLIKALMNMKVMVGINQALQEPLVKDICDKFGFKIKKAPDKEELVLSVHQLSDKEENLRQRPPIVTFMGHVDHGKTSLLDAIRKTKVAESEHGGITQHIGAYRVHLPNGEITFLDTPGHEAFTAMRARGASVTDIVVLVVAADDGIMPQTREAIDHARAAGVSIIVAVNKIDKPQADIAKVKKQLSELNLLSEDWGGKIITVEVSAKTGQGIDTLLEMILLESQMLELKANPARLAKGVVIEAKMAKGKGPVATLLIQNGTLRLNESIIVGNCYGRIRAMFNHLGQAVKEALPSYPVEVLGLSGIPNAGEQFFVIEDEKQLKELVQLRQDKEKQFQMKAIKRISLEDLYTNIKEGRLKELKLIMKADMQGSLEAIKDTVNKIDTQEIKLTVIHEGVGNINTSDIILAVASDALILGFNIVQDDRAKELSGREGVEVRIYNIIYELANDIKAALEGMLEPKLKKIFLGRIEVRKVFKLSRSGIVAGCFVTKGKVFRNSVINLLRNGQVVFEGNISSLKRFKDDVREVAEGFECGVTLGGFDSLQEGDLIEAYQIEKIARKI